MKRGWSAVRSLCALLLCWAVPGYAAELRIAVPALPATLDPHQVRTQAEFAVIAELFTGLVAIDAEGRRVPAAAESWQIGSDNLTYTFRLRDQLLWSDGTEMSAEDFEFGLRRALDPATAAPFAGRLSAIAFDNTNPKIDATGRRTLKITLAQPSSSFLDVLAEPVAMPRRRGGEALGNGLYIAVKTSNGLVLEKNPHHFAAAAARIDRATLVASDDPAAADLAWGFPPSPQSQMPADGGAVPYALIVNHSRKPFDKREVRHALAMTIERDALMRDAMRVTGLTGFTPAYNIVPPSLADYDSHQAPYMRIDTEGRAAIAAALTVDVAGGDRPLVPGLLVVPAGAPHENIAATLAAGWKALGFDIRVESQAWGRYLQTLDDGNFDLAVAPWPNRAGDALSFLAPMARTAGPWNVARYNEPVLDEHLAAADAALKPELRRESHREAEGVLIEDQSFIPLFFFVPPARINARVQGWEANARGWHPLVTLSVPEDP